MKKGKPTYRITSRVIALALSLILTCAMGASAWSLATVAQPSLEASAMKPHTMLPGMKRLSFTPGVETLIVECSSVELDLGISVFLENRELATGFAFEFKITRVDDPTVVINAVDDDKDGQVYIEKMEEGEYKVEMLQKDGVKPPAAIVATVEPKVTYQKVDISDKVKKSSEVNLAEEDAKYGGGANTNGGSSAGTSTDTVEYVESSQKVVKTEVEKPVLDANGKQVYKYKPVTSNGFMVRADGSQSDITPVVDSKGYITGATRNGVDCSAEVLNADGTPIADLFKYEAVAQTTIVVEETIIYYGWQTINGRTYYYDKNGNYVTGKQVIQGITYTFSSEGVRGGTIGIDVSTWQNAINWNQVKAAGIEFAIIRLGFRGYGSAGNLVLDDMYYAHMNGAIAAGIKVGVYFFTQAINEREAVEEASMCLQYVSGYSLSYPIAIDIEDAGSSIARTNNLTTEQRTKICIAFCETIRNSGYRASVYANKYWFESKLYAGQLSSYVIWLAHYTTASSSSYGGRYDIWQHSSTGRVNGISGNVDMNISYI